MDWIMSAGGPLICMEAALQKFWGGVERLSVAAADAMTDYDRACASGNYGTTIRLTEGSALVLDCEPLDTCFWKALSGILYIVSVDYAEADLDEITLLASLDELSFDCAIEITFLNFRSSDVILFDAAELGDNLGKEAIVSSIKPGNYRVSTCRFELNKENAFIVYKFELI